MKKDSTKGVKTWDSTLILEPRFDIQTEPDLIPTPIHLIRVSTFCIRIPLWNPTLTWSETWPQHSTCDMTFELDMTMTPRSISNFTNMEPISTRFEIQFISATTPKPKLDFWIRLRSWSLTWDPTSYSKSDLETWFGALLPFLT